MAGLTHAGENMIINDFFRKRPFYLGLLKADPTDSATNIQEVQGVSYKRQRITFREPVVGETINELEITFPIATENWGWISHIGLFTEEIGGTLIAYAGLDYLKEIRAADEYRIPNAFFIFKVD